MVPIPADPFALPFTHKSDPLRGPIFVPMDTECLMGNKSFLFEGLKLFIVFYASSVIFDVLNKNVGIYLYHIFVIFSYNILIFIICPLKLHPETAHREK